MKFYLYLRFVFLCFVALQIPDGKVLQAQTLKVPYVSLSPTAGPLWIAYEAGFFKKNNLGAELLYVPGGSVIIQSIMSGDVKVANMAPPSAIGAWAKGADLVLIASGVDQLLETVVTGPAIKSPASRSIGRRAILLSCHCGTRTTMSTGPLPTRRSFFP